MNTYTLEKGRQKAEGNIGSRPEVFFITDYPNMILEVLQIFYGNKNGKHFLRNAAQTAIST
ncbi:MAG: hypothetical protein F6K17_36035 [Okeania sp. SIO3C4]|nr:hypothetical protein [Okeania sp. SIO3B3]NER07593.1 hypothetical protein [Okeania sp. SIO3C4]